MRKLWHCTKGAVTVFVTLMLIPAILITGTGVDLARLYAARSMTRDANQLAANALMANYNALLQDMYGLYAVIGSDDELTGMVDLYVKASLLGEDVTEDQLSQFCLFDGEPKVAVSGEKPLSNVEVLRRQIEEYSKYRVPVAVVSDILERLDSNETKEMAANNQAVQKKIEIDSRLEEIAVKFAEVRERANGIRTEYQDAEKNFYSAVNGTINRLHKQFEDMFAVRGEYEEEFEADSTSERLNDIRDHYRKIAENIRMIGATGGHVGSNWIPAYIDDNGNDVPGEWGSIQGLSTVPLRELPGEDEAMVDMSDSRDQLDKFVELCQEAETAKKELERLINELETQLNSGNCSEEMAAGMKKDIDNCKELLQIDFAGLGETYRNMGVAYMEQVSLEKIEQMDGYHTVGKSISFTVLENFSSDTQGYLISHKYDIQQTDDYLALIQGDPITYKAPQSFPEFEKASEEHQKCCEILDKLELNVKSDGELSQQESKEKANFITLFKEMKKLWNGLTDYDPAPGAKSYPKSAGKAGNWAFSTTGKGMELDFGLSDFNPGGDSESDMSGALKTFVDLASGKTDVANMVGNVLDNAANRILLVGYATQMFSNWSYKAEYGGGEEDKDAPLSMTGVSIDAQHNYFLNSEWEYLVNGNLDASKNLGKATVTILVLRFLANFASTYMIEALNAEIAGMVAIVNAIPFAGGILGVLVRPLYALGESVVDVSLLRSGHAVPLIKTTWETWKFSLGGVGNILIQEADPTQEKDREKGMLYTDYLIIFLLASDPDMLASRIGDLIALNVTTAKNHLAEKEENAQGDARADAAGQVELFDLSRACTTFSLTTESDVRFVFLSMPFAQKGINGLIPPKTLQVAETDHRGY